MQRNLMTWATILLAAGAFAGSVAEVFPASEGLGLAKVAIIAGAAGRALVFAAKEVASIWSVQEVSSDDAG